MKKTHLLKNNNGSILIYILIVTAVTAGVAYQISRRIENTQLVQRRLHAGISMNMVRWNLMSYLENNTAWAATVADTATNTNMSCLRTHSVCAVGSGGPFLIKNTADIAVYSSIQTTSGFNIAGINCNNYNSVNPNRNCLFRVDLAWAPTCTLPCTPTEVKITGDFLGGNGLFNSNNYHFDIILTVP